MKTKTPLEADDVSRPLDPAERDELAAFLSSAAVAPSALTLEGMDGFLCALATGPEPLPASEWLPWVWGSDKEPQYDSDAQAHRILILMLRHGNSVRDRVPKNPVTESGGFVPLLADLATDSEYGQRWASGFMRGMSPYQDDWMAALKNPNFHATFLPILLLAHGTNLDWVDEEVTPEKRRHLADMLPMSVHMIWSYWREQNRHTPMGDTATQPPMDESQIDRDALCPCGSGKPFKHCCLH